MNILILEEDIFVYHQLCEMLDTIVPDANIIGPLSTVKRGKIFFTARREWIDLIIADIQLKDGLCFEALNKAPDDVPVIFISDTEDYAMHAFGYNSLSYLLKPITEEILREAIRKACTRLITDIDRLEWKSLVKEQMGYRKHFTVNTFSGERVIAIEEVRYFVSEGKNTYMVLHDSTSFEIGMSLTDTAKQLDPHRFMRVNRKYIVPISEIDTLEHDINGKEKLLLKEGVRNPIIIISRDKKNIVHKWINGVHTTQ